MFHTAPNICRTNLFRDGVCVAYLFRLCGETMVWDRMLFSVHTCKHSCKTCNNLWLYILIFGGCIERSKTCEGGGQNDKKLGFVEATSNLSALNEQLVQGASETVRNLTGLKVAGANPRLVLRGATNPPKTAIPFEDQPK